ncbi:MAG: hypothetical protein Ta2B_07290 [Termitinemataceae bacterium]|nr:MAG: hypothetical protein Ta2B_07290 [Termitinemataceae bacterium]
MNLSTNKKIFIKRTGNNVIRGSSFLLVVLALLPLCALCAQDMTQETTEQKIATLEAAIKKTSSENQNNPVRGEMRIKSGIMIDKAESLIKKTNGTTVHSLDLDEIAPFIAFEGELLVHNFRFTLDVLSVIPVRVGEIKEESADVSDNKDYHTAESTIDSHYKAGGSIGYRFDIGSLDIVPYAGFSYRYRKWSAENGSSGKKDFSGTLLSFSESTWYPSAGADIRYKLQGGFAFRLTGSVYPYIDVSSRENRAYYDDQFFGRNKGGIGGDVLLSVEYRKTESPFAAMISVGYEGMTCASGELSWGRIGYDVPFTKDEAFSTHFSSNIISASLLVSFRL